MGNEKPRSFAVIGVLLYINYITCVFSRGFIQQSQNPYANYVAFNLHKIKERSPNRSLS